jgi:hypothetical protein
MAAPPSTAAAEVVLTAQPRQRRDHDQHHAEREDQAADEDDQRRISLAAMHRALEQLDHSAQHPAPDQEDQDRGDQFHHVWACHRHPLVGVVPGFGELRELHRDSCGRWG